MGKEVEGICQEVVKMNVHKIWDGKKESEGRRD